MSVLSACSDAAVELNQAEITALFSASSDAGELPLELRRLANKTAESLGQAHDWQKLTMLAALTGDGTKTAFDFPEDYDRMPKKAALHSSRFADMSFTAARDLDHWLWLNDSAISSASPGNWVILGGQMNVFPAMGIGETARFYYISSRYATSAAGVAKAKFDADGDLFRLPDRLLTAGLIWRWKKQKGKAFADDLEDYEEALSEEIGKDRGSKMLIVGRQRLPANVDIAFPGVLGQP